MLAGTPALPGGACLMFALEFSSLCGSPAELRGSRRGDPARWPYSTQRLSVAPLGRPINRLNPQIAVSSGAHYLAALFLFICLSYACLFFSFFLFLMPKVQMHCRHISMAASCLFLCLLCCGVSVLVDFACQRIFKESTLFFFIIIIVVLIFYTGGTASFMSTRSPAPKRRRHPVILLTFTSSSHKYVDLLYEIILFATKQCPCTFFFLHLYLKEENKEIFIFSITRC